MSSTKKTFRVEVLRSDDETFVRVLDVKVVDESEETILRLSHRGLLRRRRSLANIIGSVILTHSQQGDAS